MFCLSAIVIKGSNYCYYLFAFLDIIAFPNWGFVLKERIYSLGSKFFSFRVDSH